MSPRGTGAKNSAANAEATGDAGSIRKIPWRRNGNPLQESCLGNPTDRSLAGYSPRVADSDTHEQQHACVCVCVSVMQLYIHTYTHIYMYVQPNRFAVHMKH